MDTDKQLMGIGLFSAQVEASCFNVAPGGESAKGIMNETAEQAKQQGKSHL